MIKTKAPAQAIESSYGYTTKRVDLTDLNYRLVGDTLELNVPMMAYSGSIVEQKVVDMWTKAGLEEGEIEGVIGDMLTAVDKKLFMALLINRLK